MLDCYIGPIVGIDVDEKGREITKIPLVDSDSEVQRIADEARKIWFSLFTNVDFTNENPAGFEFDEVRQKEVAPALLSLISELVSRLDSINDGSFTVDDHATPMLKEIIAS